MSQLETPGKYLRKSQIPDAVCPSHLHAILIAGQRIEQVHYSWNAYTQAHSLSRRLLCMITGRKGRE
jgi:hypothetical protein